MRISTRICATAVAASVAFAGVSAPAFAAEAKGPKNIIYMIGDGMGYGHIAYNNIFESGQSKYLVEGEFGKDVKELDGESVQAFEDFNRLSMSTFPHGGSYDKDAAWADHEWIKEGPTDSAAAGTAMATGVKVDNGVLGMSPYGHALENTSERAKKQGKAAGVVSSVQFSHATPAAFAAHNKNRNNYTEIAHDMINSDLDVVMGAGHPLYDDSNKELASPKYDYISQEDYEKLSKGEYGWNYVEAKEAFEKLAHGEVKEGEKYFGLAPVNTTLQQARAGEGTTPYADPRNDVTDLATMTKGALNALNTDEDGFHLMVEGGAIDWTGHANDSAREIEEVQDFNKAVDEAIKWVEENSNWEETLIIVTADHETGYLSGKDETASWNPMTGEKGMIPEGHQWYSGDHTNQLVPFFFKGAGSEDIMAQATNEDPVRGKYIDNTTVAKLTLDEWWFGSDDDDTTPGDSSDGSSDGSADGSSGSADGSGKDGSSVTSALAGAGITAAVLAAIVAVAQALGLVKILPGKLRF